MTIIVFKIIGWILLVLLIALIVLLHFSVTVNIHAGRDGFVMKAKYLFLTLYPRKKKPETDEDEADEAFDVLSDDLTDEQLMQGLTPEQETALTEQAEKPEAKEDKKEDKKEEQPKPPAEEKKDKKKKESKKEDDKPSEETAAVTDDEPEEEEKEKKPGLRERITNLRRKYEKIKPYIPMSWKWFKRLLKAVRIYIDDLWVDVGRDDAHEAAIFYGSIQAAIGTTLAECAKWFTLKVKRWDVNCRFTRNIIDGGTDVTIRVRPDTLIWLLIFTGVNFLYIWLKNKIAAKKAKKKEINEAAQTAET